MNLQLPPDLEAKLNRMAAESGRDAEQVAVELLMNSVEHDEWFRQQVERGRQSARDGQLLDHTDVASRIKERHSR